MNQDSDLHAVFAEELATNTHDQDVWHKALAYCQGDEEKAKILYVRMRLLDLKHSSKTPAPQAAKPTAAHARASEMDEARMRLAAGLASANRHSLYSVLGLSPTCDDMEIAQCIAARAKESRLAGTPLDAECRYAMDIIGNPSARTQYDKKLLADVTGNSGNDDPEATRWDASDNTFSAWWGSRKVSAIIATSICVAFGYLYINHRETKNARDRIDAAKEIENRRIDNQRYAIEQGSRIVDQLAVESAEARNRSLAIQEERARAQRVQVEHRAYLETERLELEKQREEERVKARQEAKERQARKEEERRIDRERKYWACLNNALNRSSYDKANSSCAMYK